MEFVADLHLHSRFSMATSKQLTCENLHRWSALKGVDVVGTGDFLHPTWNAELKDALKTAGDGLYRLKAGPRRSVEQSLPDACHRDVHFILTVEISLIYKKDSRTRKVHHIVMMPDFAAVERLNKRLGAIGNLKSDGRPILGLDSRDLVEICVEACEDVLFVPAHIWTPHFAALGAKSGFDSLEQCFEDMLPHIHAIETGLSSDPAMNARLSMLDDYAFISNSDAHSPQKLGREATCFDTDLSFGAVLDAIQTRDPKRLTGTIEFFPEEGKYHYDGHRKCDVCLSPSESAEAQDLCPVCGKLLTMGVLHRIEQLADRGHGHTERVVHYERLIGLRELISAMVGVGPASKRVTGVYDEMLASLGPELEILRSVPIESIERVGYVDVAEAIACVREGDVRIKPGYDGVFGSVEINAGSTVGSASEMEAQTVSGEAFE